MLQRVVTLSLCVSGRSWILLHCVPYAIKITTQVFFFGQRTYLFCKIYQKLRTNSFPSSFLLIKSLPSRPGAWERDYCSNRALWLAETNMMISAGNGARKFSRMSGRMYFGGKREKNAFFVWKTSPFSNHLWFSGCFSLLATWVKQKIQSSAFLLPKNRKCFERV